MAEGARLESGCTLNRVPGVRIPPTPRVLVPYTFNMTPINLDHRHGITENACYSRT